MISDKEEDYSKLILDLFSEIDILKNEENIIKKIVRNIHIKKLKYINRTEKIDI